MVIWTWKLCGNKQHLDAFCPLGQKPVIMKVEGQENQGARTARLAEEGLNSMPEAEAYPRSELSVTCDIADLTGGAWEAEASWSLDPEV